MKTSYRSALIAIIDSMSEAEAAIAVDLLFDFLSESRSPAVQRKNAEHRDRVLTTAVRSAFDDVLTAECDRVFGRTRV